MAKRSLKDGAGYLIIDHSESPGIRPEDIPEHLRNVMVYAGPNEVYETDTKNCAHCGTTVVLHPRRTKPRGHCWKCNAYICDNPICHKECNPIKKRFDSNKEPLILVP